MHKRTIITNNTRELKEESERLICALKEKGIDDDIIFDIHVGFEEALRNAMVHGNNSDPGKKVTVETDITGDTAVIVVEDEGEGFDPSLVPDPTLEENLLRESGRGVYLMRNLMNEVRFENGGRRVIMIKNLKRTNLK